MEGEDKTDVGAPESAGAKPISALKVVYCGVCGLPPEYCEYGPDFEKCKPWLREHCPEILEQIEPKKPEKPIDANNSEQKQGEQAAAPAAGEGKKKKQQKKKKEVTPKVSISVSQRNKRKFVTTVDGLEAFGVKLPEAAKAFSKRFACGAAVVTAADGRPEIDIQGDVAEDLVQFLQERFHISEDDIDY